MNKEKGLGSCDKCDYFISVEEAYKQGRADAIEKLEDAIINAFDDNNEKWTVISFLHKVHNIAQEQLKEKKNE